MELDYIIETSSFHQEFALFGIGICVLGILIGIVSVAWFRNQCSSEDKFYSYNVDDDHINSSTSHPLNHSVPMTNGDISLGPDAALISHSDSGGFNSFKQNSVAAVNSPNSHQADVVLDNQPINRPLPMSRTTGTQF